MLNKLIHRQYNIAPLLLKQEKTLMLFTYGKPLSSFQHKAMGSQPLFTPHTHTHMHARFQNASLSESRGAKKIRQQLCTPKRAPFTLVQQNLI